MESDPWQWRSMFSFLEKKFFPWTDGMIIIPGDAVKKSQFKKMFYFYCFLYCSRLLELCTFLYSLVKKLHYNAKMIYDKFHPIPNLMSAHLCSDSSFDGWGVCFQPQKKKMREPPQLYSSSSWSQSSSTCTDVSMMSLLAHWSSNFGHLKVQTY